MWLRRRETTRSSRHASSCRTTATTSTCSTCKVHYFVCMQRSIMVMQHALQYLVLLPHMHQQCACSIDMYALATPPRCHPIGWRRQHICDAAEVAHGVRFRGVVPGRQGVLPPGRHRTHFCVARLISSLGSRYLAPLEVVDGSGPAAYDRSGKCVALRRHVRIGICMLCGAMYGHQQPCPAVSQDFWYHMLEDGVTCL